MIGRPRIYPTEADARTAHYAAVKAERQRRIAAGLCPECRTPVSGRFVRCFDCRRYRMVIWRRWYERQKRTRRAA